MKNSTYDTVKLIECALSVLRSDVSLDTKFAADTLIYNLIVDITPSEPDNNINFGSNSVTYTPSTPSISFINPQPSSVYC